MVKLGPKSDGKLLDFGLKTGKHACAGLGTKITCGSQIFLRKFGYDFIFALCAADTLTL